MNSPIEDTQRTLELRQALGRLSEHQNKTDALQRAADRLRGPQTETVDPLAGCNVPVDQAIAQHSDFNLGDQICLAGIYYKVQKTTRRDLVLRVLKDWEVVK